MRSSSEKPFSINFDKKQYFLSMIELNGGIVPDERAKEFILANQQEGLDFYILRDCDRHPEYSEVLIIDTEGNKTRVTFCGKSSKLKLVFT